MKNKLLKWLHSLDISQVECYEWKLNLDYHNDLQVGMDHDKINLVHRMIRHEHRQSNINKDFIKWRKQLLNK